MTKKNIIVGAYGQIILNEEQLRHLKIKPGEELSCKLIPGNKLILESVMTEQKRTATKVKSNDIYELADLKNQELLRYTFYNKARHVYLLH